MDWFLFDNGLRLEKVKRHSIKRHKNDNLKKSDTGDIQLLRYHKMIRIWTFPLPLTLFELVPFWETPPGNVQNFTSVPHLLLKKQLIVWLYGSITTCFNRHVKAKCYKKTFLDLNVIRVSPIYKRY